ncbi:MAG: hypothetical protein A2711_01115 [Burkholderiales bacterium RIFCSPHIGHO2_01_FULL_63_240]|jgi:uncharacterized membrane protein YcaP (DUF421 family)|nr:MAG: hypothetical protein A2711_01115 [Burkholderiales bacterium RIFCSPHIGHO2_01_FULL_63_240]
MLMQALFGVTTSPIEIVIRGTAVYWFLFLIFRFVLRRDIGSVTIADVLVLILIADASQNAMAGEYRTLSEGALLISTIVAWNYALDWASFRWPWLSRLISPPPLLLVRHGRVLQRNLQQELITTDELLSKLRSQGVEDVSKVRKAYMEPDGSISVLK